MSRPGRREIRCALSLLLVLVVSASLASHAGAQATRSEATSGKTTWAVHCSLAPTFFDPGETTGLITPFLVLYALHDGLVKPMPGKPQAGSLAESWSVSPDGLVYEFVLRPGVTFMNGDPGRNGGVEF